MARLPTKLVLLCCYYFREFLSEDFDIDTLQGQNNEEYTIFNGYIYDCHAVAAMLVWYSVQGK